MTGPWITDVPEDVEHPPIPLGLNEMTVPRAALVLSASTLAILLVMMSWIGIAAYSFSKQLDGSFAAGDQEVLRKDGRWAWEVDFLFDTCEPLDATWTWPDNLSAQDDSFFYPGALACDWEMQGVNDHAVVVVHNRVNTSYDLLLEIDDARVEFASTGEQQMLLDDLSAYNASFAEIVLTADVDEMEFNVTARHVSVVEAVVPMRVSVIKGSEQRPVHVEDGDSLQVHYIVWDADTEEQLDEGDLPVVAGEDPTYIRGFGWGQIGLDIGNDRGVVPGIDTGTKHTVLLPPDIAYGTRDGHELQHSWLRFELELTQYRNI